MSRVEVIGNATLYLGDCIDVLRALPDVSIDSIVTDPPYGLGFMGKPWDGAVPTVEVWAECLRVLKPGGHLLAFAGTRTQHRMATAIEDAGFEIRDMIAWVYGSGFPKSLDVAKAVDKAMGAKGETVPTGDRVKRMIPGADQNRTGSWTKDSGREYQPGQYQPASAEAAVWQGFGTALKPAMEPVTVARKPLDGTVAANVLKYSTAALNIDKCRIPGETMPATTGKGGLPRLQQQEPRGPGFVAQPHELGRWPANLIHDGSADVCEAFPDAPGQLADASTNADQQKTQNVYGVMRRGRGGEASATSPNEGAVGFHMRPGVRRLDAGSAARFFYCAKASKEDREPGNNHPTVKPTDLMRYLCRLVTPPGGTVLDPYMGSGSTGKAALAEGFGFIGADSDHEAFLVACRRIEDAQRQQRLFA